jgi:hypothetical protein
LFPYLIAFDSTQQAIRAEMLLEYINVEIDTCPTPKQITAKCAISIRFDGNHLQAVNEMIREERIIVQGIYFVNEEGYSKIF